MFYQRIWYLLQSMLTLRLVSVFLGASQTGEFFTNSLRTCADTLLLKFLEIRMSSADPDATRQITIAEARKQRIEDIKLSHPHTNRPPMASWHYDQWCDMLKHQDLKVALAKRWDKIMSTILEESQLDELTIDVGDALCHTECCTTELHALNAFRPGFRHHPGPQKLHFRGPSATTRTEEAFVGQVRQWTEHRGGKGDGTAN